MLDARVSVTAALLRAGVPTECLGLRAVRWRLASVTDAGVGVARQIPAARLHVGPSAHALLCEDGAPARWSPHCAHCAAFASFAAKA